MGKPKQLIALCGTDCSATDIKGHEQTCPHCRAVKIEQVAKDFKAVAEEVLSSHPRHDLSLGHVACSICERKRKARKAIRQAKKAGI